MHLCFSNISFFSKSSSSSKACSLSSFCLRAISSSDISCPNIGSLLSISLNLFEYSVITTPTMFFFVWACSPSPSVLTNSKNELSASVSLVKHSLELVRVASTHDFLISPSFGSSLEYDFLTLATHSSEDTEHTSLLIVSSWGLLKLHSLSPLESENTWSIYGIPSSATERWQRDCSPPSDENSREANLWAGLLVATRFSSALIRSSGSISVDIPDEKGKGESSALIWFLLLHSFCDYSGTPSIQSSTRQTTFAVLTWVFSQDVW